MTVLNERLIALRRKVRANSKHVIDTILADHNADICVFCGAVDDLTREHVLPRWVFDKRPDRGFITTINEQSQNYEKATVPACRDCNSNILAHLERRVKLLLSRFYQDPDFFSEQNQEALILWLETIDYKFQVLNLRRRFLRHKQSDYIPFLASIPLGIMQDSASLSPSKVFSRVRNSLKRLGVKSKERKFKSLLLFRSSNPGFGFFHRMHDFIFLDFPEMGVALFHFYEREFEVHADAHAAAMEIISDQYGSDRESEPE
ncbi:MAG: hypothetical protein AAF809_03155 [Bacteroidota bacterium]